MSDSIMRSTRVKFRMNVGNTHQYTTHIKHSLRVYDYE
jgi:hypothetical protein